MDSDSDDGVTRLTVTDDITWSDFLREKLTHFKHIQQFSGYPNLWFADDCVIKRYTYKQLFDAAVQMQTHLFSKDPLIACELLETWDNNCEWFIVSRSGGVSPGETAGIKFYTYEDVCAFAKMAEVRIKLKNMGLFLFDDHDGNYVIDSEGVCRVIDYEAIENANLLRY